MVGPLRKGQAEVVGSLVVVSVLLLVIIPLLLSTTISTTTTGTRNFVLRSQFEIERWSEKLELSVDNTTLINPSPVDITIVRIWTKTGGPQDVNPITIPAGGGILPISNLGVGLQELEAIVTARGRVFKISELLPPTPRPPTAPPLGLTGEEVVGGSKLFEQDITVIRCRIDSRNCTDPLPAIYYDGTWWVYYNSSVKWVRADQVNIIVNVSAEFRDMDKNNAPELLVLHKVGDKYYVVSTNSSAKSLEFAINFSRYVEIRNATTLISVFLKTTTASSQDVSEQILIRVVLSDSFNSSNSISNIATLSSAKVPKGSYNVTVYEGYVLFPVVQFGYFYNVISRNTTYYDVIVEVFYTQPQSGGGGEAATGIEYIAVATAFLY